MRARARTLLLYALAVAAVALGLGALFAGAPGLLATATYLGLVLAPGLVILGVLDGRYRETPSGVIETAVLANLFGLALTAAVGWTLARFDVFSIGTVVAGDLAFLLGLGWWARRDLRAALHRLLDAPSVYDPSELVYLLVVLGVSLAILLPMFLLQSSGYLVGDDTATFAYCANQLVRTGNWAVAIQIFPALPATPDNIVLSNPAIVIVYAEFAQAAGINALYLTGPLYLLPTVVSTLALYLLLTRFARSRLVCYLLPLVWLLGSESANTLFYNNVTNAIYYGIVPDAIFSFVGYIVALYAMVDLARPSADDWRSVYILSGAILLVTLFDQLSFLLLALAVLLFGIWVLIRRGWRFALSRWVVAILPTLAAIPPYLLPSIVAGTSPALSGRNSSSLSSTLSVAWAEILPTIGFWGVLAVSVAVVGLLIAILRPGGLRRRSPGLSTTVALALLLLIALGSFYLAFSSLGTTLLGITPLRFAEFAGISLVPLLAVAADWPIEHASAWRPRRRTAVAAVVVGVLVVTAGLAAQSSFETVPVVTESGTLFTPSLLAAGVWLGDHVPAGVTVVGDGMNGNQALEPIADFLHSTFFVRPRWSLPVALTEPDIGTAGNPFAVLNQVLEYPTAANAATAWQNFSMGYYVFQAGFSDAEISVFGHLAYFQLVFANSQVSVFEYVGGNGPGFVGATDFTTASSALTTTFEGYAYSSGFGLPRTPNVVTSVTQGGAALDGSTLNYTIANATAGVYTLLVHRSVYQVTEFLDVDVDGAPVGSTYFSSYGLTYGSPLNITLPAGTSTLTLELQGTVGYMDPIDYFLLTPA